MHRETLFPSSLPTKKIPSSQEALMEELRKSYKILQELTKEPNIFAETKKANLAAMAKIENVLRIYDAKNASSSVNTPQKILSHALP